MFAPCFKNVLKKITVFAKHVIQFFDNITRRDKTATINYLKNESVGCSGLLDI